MQKFLAGLMLFGAVSAADVSAQATNCTNRPRPGSNLQANNVGLPNEVTVVTKPDLLCDGGRRILADLATVSKASGRIELVNNVDVQDPEQRMQSDRATFFSRTKHLTANGRVILTTKNGSTIRGDLLEYDQKTDQRPSRIESTGTTNFARAVLIDTTGAKRDSTVIDASQIIITGEESFRAINNAVMTRDSMRATGALIDYSKADSSLVITGNGRVVMRKQTATGDSITARLGADNEIRDVLTRHGASLRDENMSVVAPGIRLFFDKGNVTRMVAMNWKPAQNAMPAARARVDAEDFKMDADSIDIEAPGGELTSAVAIGSAYGERVTPDSLVTRLPEAEEATKGIIANDWMRGDTLRAFFAPNPKAAQDTSAAAQVLERILAVGQPAQSVYRIHNTDKPDAKLSISYLNAKRIEVSFEGGIARVVLAEGDVKGIYLQPGDTKPATTNRTGGSPGGK